MLPCTQMSQGRNWLDWRRQQKPQGRDLPIAYPRLGVRHTHGPFTTFASIISFQPPGGTWIMLSGRCAFTGGCLCLFLKWFMLMQFPL